MRRTDREITKFSKITEIIASCDCCRLGLIDGDETYIVPLNFGYDIIDGRVFLYFHCAKEGRKIDLISKQPKVSFEMDTKHELKGGKIGCDFSYLYQSVVGMGQVSFLVNRDVKTYGLQKIMEHYTDKCEWEFDDKVLNDTTVFKLTVQSLSCKEH